MFRYTPTDSIILLYTIEPVNHITASSFSQSGLVYSDAVGDVYIVSISISGLVSKRICIDAGIAISLAFLDDNLITVFNRLSFFVFVRYEQLAYHAVTLISYYHKQRNEVSCLSDSSCVTIVLTISRSFAVCLSPPSYAKTAYNSTEITLQK